MFRKTIVFMLIAAMTAWMPPALLADGGEAIIKGKFTAEGEGFLHLEGQGSAVLEGHGKEVILIHNVSKTKVLIQGKGQVIPLPGEDAILVIGFKGVVDLKGKHLSLTSHGGPVELEAKGHGTVWLRGKGVFKIGGKPPHKWPKKKVMKFKY